MAQSELRQSPVVSAGGTARAEIRVSNGLDTWTVSQISTEMAAGAGAGATCAVRKNGTLVTPMIAAADVAGGEPYVLLRPSDVLSVEWAGCTPGAVGTVLAFFDDGRG